MEDYCRIMPRTHGIFGGNRLKRNIIIEDICV
jgi:hypothetical protein